MRIEFDPTNPTEAAAVRAMLTALTARNAVPGNWTEPESIPVAARIDPSVGYTLGSPFVGLDKEKEPTVTLAKQYPDASLDSTATPWDERIHSTPATTNKDGTWRAKRGVTAEQIAAVRAEREATQPVALAEETVEEHIAEVASIAAAFEESVTVPLVEPAVSAPATPPAPPASAPSSTPIPAPTPPAPPANAGTSFLDVMKAITAAQKDGKIDTAKVKELCAAVGAGESTMGLNGPDNGDKRVAFMALLAEETK